MFRKLSVLVLVSAVATAQVYINELKRDVSESRISHCVDNGNGVADNGSGASLLLSLFETLTRHARERTYTFIAFTDEGKGIRYPDPI